MELTTSEQHEDLTLGPTFNRRRGLRLSGRFGLTFSCVDQGRIVMGDGHVMDLSHEGIGIRGNCLLKAGMDLALFIELPDSEDPLCVPEARISWVQGQRFGVALRTLRLEDQHRLRLFLWQEQQSCA